MDTLQTELDTEYPLLDIQILGVNWVGLEAANSEMVQDKSLPWLQDADGNGDGQSDVWAAWGTDHLDLVVLDGNNEGAGRTNLGTYNLQSPEAYAGLRNVLIDAAMTSQKPWRNAEEALDVNDSGTITPLDALIIINRLDANGSQELPPPVASQSPPPYYDTNGDGNSTPLDVLLVINYLNARSPLAGGEGESSAPGQAVVDPTVSAATWRSTEPQDTEPPSDAAWQTQADRMFSTSPPDWLPVDSAALDSETDLPGNLAAIWSLSEGVLLP